MSVKLDTLLNDPRHDVTSEHANEVEHLFVIMHHHSSQTKNTAVKFGMEIMTPFLGIFAQFHML